MRTDDTASYRLPDPGEGEMLIEMTTRQLPDRVGKFMEDYAVFAPDDAHPGLLGCGDPEEALP